MAHPHSSPSYAQAAPPAPAAGPLPDPADVAIIAWHGIGQQIRFETVETIVRALAHNGRDRGYHAENVQTRFVQLGTEKMWRAELDLRSPHGRSRRIHVYEAYWAPFTEGKISLKQTVAFLYRAGAVGLWYCFIEDFRRHLFGRWRTFPVNWMAAGQLLALILFLTSLIVMNFAVATVTSASVLTGGGAAWPSYRLIGDLTIDFALFEAFTASLLAVLWAVYFLHRPYRRNSKAPAPPRGGAFLIWLLVGLAVVATILAGALVARHLLRHRSPTASMWWAWPVWIVNWATGVSHSWPSLAGVAAIWIVAVAVSYLLKSLFVEYVGDVAIYIASHRLDAFFETRQKIKEVSLTIAQAIYEHGQYSQHLLVGHSLGSVIAYDTLNRLLNEDALKNYQMNVEVRTRGLVTLGSPLDKTAFLFRAQSEFSDVREAMAAAAQPLISDYRTRPAWVNIYSPHDPISGHLDYYDPPDGQDEDIPLEFKGSRISNIADVQAWTPLLAHNQYWEDDLFAMTLRVALSVEDPDETATAAALAQV